MKSNKFLRLLFLAGGIVFIAGVLIFTSLPLSKGTSSLHKVVKKESIAGMGCLFNSDRLKKESFFLYEEEDNPNLTMLPRYSLEEYLPEIGDQGDVGSCVGWSTTYYGFTIIKRLEHGKDYPVFSPLSVFNRFSYFKGFNPCDNGAYIDECLGLLVSKGCPFEKDYDKPNCSVDPTRKRFNDCLFNFERLQHNNATQIKLALANNNPVIIGMNVFSGGKGNNLNSRFLDSNGVVKMDNFRSNKYRVGGHALCIVGYDDEIGGGAFKIANSWGKDWGKNGFFWLRYSDLEVVRCAYAMFSDDSDKKVKSQFKTRSVSLQNYSKKNVFACVGYKTSNGMETRGWYLIQSGQSRNISIADRLDNEVFYMLMNEDGKLMESKSNKYQFAAKLNASFNYVDESSDELYGYNKINPINKRKNQIFRIVGVNTLKLEE